jgi:hypothetical protein
VGATVGAAVAGAAVAGAAVAGAAVAGAAVAGAAVAGAEVIAAGLQAVMIMLIAMITDKNKGILLYIVFSFCQILLWIWVDQRLGQKFILARDASFQNRRIYPTMNLPLIWYCISGKGIFSLVHLRIKNKMHSLSF